MSTYVINYDLRSPGRNYSDLYIEIKSLGDWWHHLESTWIVDTSLTAAAIRDRLKAKIDANDKVLVTKTGLWWATFGLTDRANDWLKSHVD